MTIENDIHIVSTDSSVRVVAVEKDGQIRGVRVVDDEIDGAQINEFPADHVQGNEEAIAFAEGYAIGKERWRPKET